jgi:hypothetical protein
MVKAINKLGRVSNFTQQVWDMLPAHKCGFMEIKHESDPINIPEQIIEFRAKKIVREEPVKESVPDIAALKEYLNANHVKFHHLSGYGKLKQLYDDHKEQQVTDSV